MSTSKGCASASRMGTSSSGCRRHSLTFPPIPSFWHVACPSSSISCFDFWDRKTTTQTRQRGCCQLTLVTVKPEDPSDSLHNHQDPSSRFLTDNKEFVSLKTDCSTSCEKRGSEQMWPAGQSSKAGAQKKGGMDSTQLPFLPSAGTASLLGEGAGSAEPCLAKSELKALHASILSHSNTHRSILGHSFTFKFHFDSLSQWRWRAGGWQSN